MKNALSVLTVFCVFLILTCFGCASMPEEQLKQAQEAMDQANALHAEDYVPSDYKAAKEVWDQAQAQLGSQRYGEAGTLLVRAKNRFQKARDLAKYKRDTLQKDIEDMQMTIGSRFGALKNNVTNSRLSAARKKEMVDAVVDLDKQVQDLEALMKNEEFIQAKPAAQNVLRQIYETELKLQGKGTKS